MTTAVVHDNPGLVDVRALTVMGISAKPLSKSPIGYFGTGMKYAVAVLVREGCGVTIWIGEEPHEFVGRKIDFRGKEFLQIYMRRQRGATRKWMPTELPFTTELGRNWEVWQALRELHSNCLDEGGTTYQQDADGLQRFSDGTVCPLPSGASPEPVGRGGMTRIVVTGEVYVDAYRHLGEIFLPDAADGGALGVQRLPRESRYGYYRGMRALELRRPALSTWNVTTALELTEDRTLKYAFMFDYYVRQYLAASDDAVLLRRVLQAPDGTYEETLDWSDWTGYCSPAFLHAARTWGGRRTEVIVVRERDREEREARARRAVPTDWRLDLARALREPDLSDAVLARAVRPHVVKLAVMLEHAADRHPAEERDEPPTEVAAPAPAHDDVPF